MSGVVTPASASDVYLETLLLYYEEEVAGEAYFHKMAERFDDPDKRGKMVLLGQVEAHAARCVEPLIRKYDLTPRSREVLVKLGIEEALADSNDWRDSLSQMRETYPGYVDDFLALEAMGPPKDHARLAFLTGHEHAALEFLALEEQGAADSGAPLRAYLAANPDSVVMPWRD